MRVPGRPSSRWSEPPGDGLPPCSGRHQEWESTSPMVIAKCQAVCRSCPLREWCEREAVRAERDGLSLVGVWAGASYGDTPARSGSAA